MTSVSRLNLADLLKLAGALVLAYAAVQAFVTLKEVLLIVLTALIVALAMERVICMLEVRRIPRLLSATLLYAVGLFSFGLMLFVVVPPLLTEFGNIVTLYPGHSSALAEVEEVRRLDIVPYVRALSTNVADNPGAVLALVFKTFTTFTTVLAIFFVAFFLNIHKGGLTSFIYPFLPERYRERCTDLVTKLREKVGSWLWGKTLSSLIVGAVTFVGLLIMQVPYALSLGVFAFALNFVPFIGPIIAAIPAVALGLASSIPLGVLVALYYLFINGVLESFVLTPLFMRQAIEVNPALIILFVISGAYVGGVLGIVIALPLSAIINVLLHEYRSGGFRPAQTREP